MPIADALLPEFDHEMATTRKCLERCPEDKFGWKPHEKSFTLVALANHVANMPGWAVDMIEKDSVDVAPPGAEPYKMVPPATTKEMLATFDNGAATFRRALAGTSDAHLMQPWSLLNGGTPIFTMPRVAILRGMIMNHLIHHRGQLTVYLRMNNIPVPSIYGPSADEAS